MTVEPPPNWIRSLLAADRMLEKTAWLLRTTLARALCGSVPPTARDVVTAWVYGNEPGYRPGSGLFDTGLFPWELEAVRTRPFPPAGRLLVGGAGGGREMAALARLGYEVVAFEPSPLVEGAAEAARDLPGVEVVKASYRDVVAFSGGRKSPMAAALTGGFDGVVLGWGSLSHIVSGEERRDLLRSLRDLFPSAPVLCSFWSDPGPDRPTPGRRALHRLGSWAERFQEPGLRFLPHAGFIHVFTRGEFEDLARHARYRVVTYAGDPFPHALLAPLCDDPHAAGDG